MKALQERSNERTATARIAPFRLGVFPYVNILPVYHYLPRIWQEPQPFPLELVSGTPTSLNARLAEGAASLSPISSIELALHPDRYLVLEDFSLHSVGPVQSVLLLSRHPIEELDGKDVALTTASATSRVLLSVLLSESIGVRPRYRDLPTGDRDPLADHDAVLLIGDAALTYEPGPDVHRYDLAELWHQATGAPMVFAVWATRRDLPADELQRVRQVSSALQRSLEHARTHMGAVVREAAARLNFTERAAAAYFRHLRYDLDGLARQGLHLFFECAVRAGEVAGPVRVEFLGKS